MTVAVDTAAYEAASRVFGSDLAGVVEGASTSLWGALSGLTAMAGSDPAGAQWATAYDAAAAQTVQVLDDLRRACVTVGGLLEMSGFNHARADAHSDMSGSSQVPPDTTSYDPGPGVCVAAPPSAAGGTLYPPHGWDEVARWCGAVWPDGDPGKLREAAAVWRTAASTLESGQPLVTDGMATVAAQSSPEIESATAVCRSLGESLAVAAEQCRTIASACDELAEHIDDAHDDLLEQIAEFFAITVAIEVGGAILGALTAGIGELAAQAGEGAEVASVIARIAAVLDRLLTAAKTVTTRIAATGLDATSTTLRAILSRVPRLAETAPVARTVEGIDGLAARLAAQILTVPRTDSLAEDLAQVVGGTVRTNKGGYTVTIPNGSRGISVRIMDEGGGRVNYYRISVPGKAAYTLDGVASVDPALTHIAIEGSSLDDIIKVVSRIRSEG